MLVENTLWGERDKVQIATQRLQQFEPPEGYYLAFSGGKDSITIYRLAELAGVQFDAHYHVTTVDPPELVRFIKTQYPQVARERPEMTMFQLILKVKHWPPMWKQRWCCELLKEHGGEGRIVLTGVRWAESVRRRHRQMVESCVSRRITNVRPIIDWSDDDVWEFIHREGLAYCSLYDEGFTRLGCVLCPLAAHPEWDIARWPKLAAAYKKTFDKLLPIRQKLGKTTRFETGQELFDWWIKRNTKPPPQEARLFD